MLDYADIHFAPDIDTYWARSPGALTSINAFAPLQAGYYGSIGTASHFNLTGSNHYIAYAFRQINGSVRYLTFRGADIDEYDSAGTRTNRGTGYTGGMWSATAWGNQIIATNYTDAVQSSTGAGFSNLGGSPPRARIVASNQDFVMLFDIDDASLGTLSDAAWWSGIRNPNTYAINQATQAGYKRLVEIPGPIRAGIPFRDKFVAFKDNGFMVGEYIGPPYVFGWRVMSQRVGTVGMHSVAELDGKLYFLHTSGFWEFDGQNLRNVGLPVFQSFLSETDYITGGSGSRIPGPGATATGDSLSLCQTAVDDIEGVIWFRTGYSIVLSSNVHTILYGYNARSGKWGRHAVSTALGNNLPPALVRATASDMQAFKADPTGRIWMEWNTATATLQSIRYPLATTDSTQSAFTTGVWGDQGTSSHNASVYLRHVKGTESLASGDVSATLAGYVDEAQNTTNGSSSMSYNTEKNALDGTRDANYKTATVSYAAGKKVVLGGVALDDISAGRRNRRGG